MHQIRDVYESNRGPELETAGIYSSVMIVTRLIGVHLVWRYDTANYV